MGFPFAAIRQLIPKTDVPEILAMIYELADYEKAASAVEATEGSLKRTLIFAPSPTASHSNSTGYARTLILRLPSATTSDPRGNPVPHPDTAAAPLKDQVIGMALYFNNYSTWRSKPGVYLEDLFVRPQYRGRGYGKLLLKALAREVLRIDGGRLEWSCLTWNEPSLQFYRSIGAKELEGWVGLRVDGDALVKLASGEIPEITSPPLR